jgi:hypothetical protein
MSTRIFQTVTIATVLALAAAACGSGSAANSAPTAASTGPTVDAISFSAMAQKLHAKTCWHGGTGGHFACEWNDGIEEAGNTYEQLKGEYQGDAATASDPTFKAQEKREHQLCGTTATTLATPAVIACSSVADTVDPSKYPAIKRTCGRPTAKESWFTCAVKVGS